MFSAMMDFTFVGGVLLIVGGSWLLDFRIGMIVLGIALAAFALTIEAKKGKDE